MKYRILFNCGTEGYIFQEEEFETITQAVKYAVELCYPTPFLIVQIVDWEVLETSN